ncbi:hypothetical protein [Nocardioides euryhalodurans]|uniref:Uncharacterized protein n=1 Tax=Nocardioides euryhalodurans TaxID=2518370 RepID=A0A4P7GKC9_9ACTN|nr:hypothetical protein [Nocardioides euryhalodurans]QBR92239.1 hypothetical protein EXE57_08010 [Nocardioides euryhalodurans]
MSTTAPSAHHRRSSPGSRAGRWAVALAGASLAGMAASVVAFALGVESADGFADNWLLTGWGAAVLACAGGSVVAGGLALLRRHDRSWPVVTATVVGALMTALMLQQVAEGLGILTS